MKFLNISRMKRVFTQIRAVTEKDLKLKSRYYLVLFKDLAQPIISAILPFIIMNFIFSTTSSIGYWNSSNYILFIMLGYLIYLLRGIVNDIPNEFITEKYWKTIEALMIAPLNRFVLMIGKFVSNLLFILIPIVGILIVGFIIYPISTLTLFSIILIVILISVAFIGVGGILGIFAITRENYWRLLDLGLFFLFFLSAVNYPIEIFPEIIQFFIRLNPLYYWFDTIRVVWIENNILFSLGAHPFHFMILISSSVLLPIITVYLFDFLFRKWGIEGY